ncbi:MAG: hypothetical protein JRD93_02650 [Deltaproteobacteria bacterium]|nr:hypothetical protein [Deltaproteobacteria bacterium]
MQQQNTKTNSYLSPLWKEILNYYKVPLPFHGHKSNANLKKKIDPRIISKWQQQLSPFQINIFETIAGDTLEENGYELVGKKIDIPKTLKLWFWIQQRIVGEMQL